MRGGAIKAILLILLMFSAAFSGCFANNNEDGVIGESSLTIAPDPLTAGIFQTVYFKADEAMRIMVPYLILQPITGYVQNGTVLDLQKNDEVEIIILIPPRIESFVVLFGELGREYFPIRDGNISWQKWIENGMESSKGVKVTDSEIEGGLPQLMNSSETGDAVSTKTASIIRPISSSVTIEDGGMHSTGIVSGFETYNMLSVLSDETVDPTDNCDLAKGYLNRWAGMGSPGYECGADFLVAEFTEYGYENVERHRFQYIEGNPEAYNICAYKEGYEYPDEWMVIGAHFDIAPIIAPTPVDLGAPRGYGTRVGAYDNTVGTSVVLNMAEAMFDIPTRRGIVFCLWSSEEGGKRGSIAWVQDIPEEVTISNYINIDMGGVNWPGNGTPSDRVGPDGSGSYPASQENWPFRVYIGPDTEEDVINQPEMVYLAEWLAGDALGVEEQLAVLNGELNNAWAEAGEPGIIINEATTARSDHASFQAIDTVTVGFGGLVDGYDCYHQTCDTIDEMLYWMENDYASGMQNLINSIDLMTWYGTMMFLHLDHQPILNSYL